LPLLPTGPRCPIRSSVECCEGAVRVGVRREKNDSCKLFEKIIHLLFSRKKLLLTDIHSNNTDTV
jgi:hypothetical protein